MTPESIKRLSDEFGIEQALVRTVMAVESSGKGFSVKTGKIVIQFEPRWFKRYTGVAIPNKVELQNAEWKAFEIAKSLSEEAAYKSTSWGLGQIMGFNHAVIGYATAKAMALDFMKGEEQQLRGMLKFIAANKRMFIALKAKNWRTFAYYYNGPAYEEFDYHIKLPKAYDKYSSYALVA